MLLREMLPPGWFRLVTEMEGTLTRIIPHVFQDVIAEDDFTWLAMTFDKKVKKPEMLNRIETFRRQFAAFTWELHEREPASVEGMSNADFMRTFIAEKMETEVRGNKETGDVSPIVGSNYGAPHIPQIWIRSPMQSAGETNRVVGFPLVRERLRRDLKGLRFSDEIADPELRARAARLVYTATLRSVSTFFNSIRERTSPAVRAAGGGARSSSSYVNGSSFNPHVLFALLNIYRVNFNWCEDRTYSSAWSDRPEQAPVAPGTAKARVPGTDQMIELQKRRSRAPVKRTPAMRLGIQEERHNPKTGRLIMPSLHRILYRPWIYYGTPLWEKFENPKADLRRRRAGAKKEAVSLS